MNPDYRQQLEAFYLQKSKLNDKYVKNLHPKKNSKKKVSENKLKESFRMIHDQIDNPYSIQGNALKRQYFINEQTLISNLKNKVIELSKKVKEYELDILYELFDSSKSDDQIMGDYDKYVKQFEDAQKKYKDVIEQRKLRLKKENTIKEIKHDEIERFIDSYKLSTEMDEKRSIYADIIKHQNEYFKLFNNTDIIMEKQRVRIDDDNDKNKDETNIMVHRCWVNYEPIVDINVKLNQNY